MQAEAATDRTVFRITGADRVHFLQGLVTNDVSKLDGGLIYAALLSPQGKYLFDFFLAGHDDCILLDVKTDLADALLKRLTMYKLRADVAIEPSGLSVQRGLGPAPTDAWPDPRDPALGWRAYTDSSVSADTTDWEALRVAHCIPETGIELIPDATFILEAGFERLNGVDFRKGCYVGQEVTARMKHKTELKKGLVTVAIDGAAPVGSEIMADGKFAGTLYTQANGQALALLRFDRAAGPMTAGDATVTWDNG
ncbi:Folate-dependent protein for Fe/S cluster synthesis/repair in oxidative stress [Rhodovulum sp. P5]|uniref:CAF17-like 4Fe-4S cluster assembly/insertion protein YgfZ n=1 Tax=Rhodovulum sp. P5 TaxID=1564506 RepID=UPI0009C3BE77|nr:folate-binding protein YgfZ [Rhodovulum sp. P5]ARE39905.1 Folate-dependent protein for Fe/S cluster synthesis/repair in oxidative stress [Rhodovulum sp. P5]